MELSFKGYTCSALTLTLLQKFKLLLREEVMEFQLRCYINMDPSKSSDNLQICKMLTNSNEVEMQICNVEEKQATSS
jgi:hypothetical protein